MKTILKGSKRQDGKNTSSTEFFHIIIMSIITGNLLYYEFLEVTIPVSILVFAVAFIKWSRECVAHAVMIEIEERNNV